MLTLNAIYKRFGTFPVLNDFNLTLAPGQITVLIGPSGCGKSTLLRLFIGLIEPDNGTVSIDGISLTPENVRSIRKRFGYVIQEGGLFPHLTARENVTLMADFLEWEPTRQESRLEALAGLTRFPMAGFNQFPAQLSGGQRQRVALMRALMLDPDVLLLDEPLGSLDPMTRYDLQNDLKSIFQSLGKTVVLVTHDMGEASFFGDTIVLLRGGKIVQEGSPRDLFQNPADPFVERFIRAQRSGFERIFGEVS